MICRLEAPGQAPRRVVLQAERVRVGGAPENDLIMGGMLRPSTNLLLSRRGGVTLVELFARGYGLLLEIPTLNGAPAAEHVPHLLHATDEICFHDHRLSVEDATADPVQAAALARDPAQPIWWLDKLGQLFPVALGQNPLLPLLLVEDPAGLSCFSPALLAAMAAHADESWIPLILAGADASPAAEDARERLEDLAADPKTSPARLARLAEHPALQLAVAGNPAAPRALLTHWSAQRDALADRARATLQQSE